MTGSTKNHEQKMDLHRAGELFHIQTVFDFEMLSLKVKGLGTYVFEEIIILERKQTPCFLFKFNVIFD